MRISDWSSYVCSSDLAAEPPKPAATVGVGFAVQIGAFSNTAQAIAKRDELRAAGFSAFTETVQTDKGTLTRVLAGPVVSRPEAEQLNRSEEHTSELQSLMRISYAVFCLKKKKTQTL